MTVLTSVINALQFINNGDDIIVTGFVNQSVPKALINGLNDLNRCDLGLMCTTGIVELGNLRTDIFCSAVMGHYGLLPNFQQAIDAGTIVAYNYPQGVLTELLTCESFETTIGKGTFVEHTLGRVSHKELPYIEVKQDTLLYKNPLTPTIAIIRAKCADSNGSLMLDDLSTDVINAINTVFGNGGIVIAEVQHVLDIELDDPDVHFGQVDIVCHVPVDADDDVETRSQPDHIRAYMQRIEHLFGNPKFVNLGIGLPEAAAGFLPAGSIPTVEAGVIGGNPLGGAQFGDATNAITRISHNEMFHHYWGGMLDLSILGVGEFDMTGNVNVHDFGRGFTGCGGFIDISMFAAKLIFVGKDSKVVDDVSSITFNGADAFKRGQEVYYVTETSIYKLTENGLELHHD